MRDKIESRFTTSLGCTELSGDTPAVRSLEEQQAQQEKSAKAKPTDRLAWIAEEKLRNLIRLRESISGTTPSPSRRRGTGCQLSNCNTRICRGSRHGQPACVNHGEQTVQGDHRRLTLWALINVSSPSRHANVTFTCDAVPIVLAVMKLNSAKAGSVSIIESSGPMSCGHVSAADRLQPNSHVVRRRRSDVLDNELLTSPGHL